MRAWMDCGGPAVDGEPGHKGFGMVGIEIRAFLDGLAT